jgi:hypothetical protein
MTHHSQVGETTHLLVNPKGGRSKAMTRCPSRASASSAITFRKDQVLQYNEPPFYPSASALNQNSLSNYAILQLLKTVKEGSRRADKRTGRSEPASAASESLASGETN